MVPTAQVSGCLIILYNKFAKECKLQCLVQKIVPPGVIEPQESPHEATKDPPIAVISLE